MDKRGGPYSKSALLICDTLCIWAQILFPAVVCIALILMEDSGILDTHFFHVLGGHRVGLDSQCGLNAQQRQLSLDSTPIVPSPLSLFSVGNSHVGNREREKDRYGFRESEKDWLLYLQCCPHSEQGDNWACT